MLTSSAVLCWCQTRRESDELIVLTGFCFARRLPAAACTLVLHTMRKDIRKLCFFSRKVPWSRWWLFMLEWVLRAALEPSSAEVGPWFVSACCALALSSPLSGCSVSAEAKNISTINKSPLRTNRDRLHHCFFDLGLLAMLRLTRRHLRPFLFLSHLALTLQKFCRHFKNECSA